MSKVEVPRLRRLLRTSKAPIILSGPYGSYAAERMAKRLSASPQSGMHTPIDSTIGVGLALFSGHGREELEEIATEYARSVPRDQPMALTTPTYRIQHKTLNLARTRNPALNAGLPGMGLQAILHSERLALNAIRRSGRRRENTLIFMSIGTPFDSYRGEDTPLDILNETLPQVFAAVRYAKHVDNLMFETVPSLDAAIAAARAFKISHDRLNIHEFTEREWSPKLLDYLGMTPEINVAQGIIQKTALAYDHKAGTYGSIKPTKTYTISFNLDRGGKVLVRSKQDPHKFVGISLNEAIKRLNEVIRTEGLIRPEAITLNCNSPEHTRKHISEGVSGVHMNRAIVADSRKYGSITQDDEMPHHEFVQSLKALQRARKLRIIGVCCGGTPELVREIARGMRESRH